MLDSLEHNIQPTRAEVTDVFFAVERGADATMLSGETANGEFPVNAVEIMSNIDVKSEILFDYERAINVYFPKTKLLTKVLVEPVPEKCSCCFRILINKLLNKSLGL